MLWLKAVRFVRHAHVLVGVLTVVLLAMPVSGGAQAKIPRIGVLRIGAPADTSTDIFRQTMRDLGYLAEASRSRGGPVSAPHLVRQLAGPQGEDGTIGA